ncbi:MAG: type II toxin-antitoxin system VapC family toxin [Actinobacteria bacterium]|nr:type II toxin-antitoxin system VapC family toxin [Actinomycetota bacterium]
MLVIDTSAVIEALARLPVNPDLSDRLVSDGDLRAPHLIDVEVQHALAKLVRNGSLRDDQADQVRRSYDLLAITRYPHTGLAGRMWELRRNLTAHDAAFVALAEALEAPLVTCDRRIARAPGHTARVEIY